MGDEASTTLQPGQSIKPNLSLEEAKELIKEHFGQDVSSIKELNSYDDKNYYVKANDVKFIFKVLNSMDTLKTSHIEAQHQILFHLASKGVNCPIPQKNLDGKTYSIVSLPSKQYVQQDNPSSQNHLIRLFTFVEGQIMYDVPITAKLVRKAGAYIAEIQNHFKGLNIPVLQDHNSTWLLGNCMEVEKFIYVIKDQPQRCKMVKDIVSSYKISILPALPDLEKGIVHGDYNEQNILVQPSSTEPEEHVISGIIDFGDIHVGPYIFELAITVCYMMLESIRSGIVDPFEAAGHVVAGYSSQRRADKPLPLSELKLLRVLVACRLCQSLVYGAYTHSQDPGNVYVLTTAGRGWTLMNQIWNENTDEQFFEICSKYL